MDVVNVEVLSLEQAIDMRRQARQYRKEESERHDRMSMRELRYHFAVGLVAQATARGSAPVKPPLAFASEGLNAYEETAAIAEFLFAQPSEGKALLVKFSYSPSRAFVDRFRQEAKSRKLTVRFFRLTGGWVIITVQSKQLPDESDHKLLKDFGVQW